MLSPRDTQTKMCEQQLSMAEETDKLFTYDRDASNDLYDLVKNFPGIRGVVTASPGFKRPRGAGPWPFYRHLAWCLDERRGQAFLN